MSELTKTPKQYLAEPYARVLTPDEESGTYTAEILEFPGCVSQGNTPEEAYKNLEIAAKGWIEAALDLRSRDTSALGKPRVWRQNCTSVTS